MKKYLKYCLATVLLTIIVSCGKSFYYTKHDLTNDSNNFNSKVIDSFITDSSSEVFVRRLYIDRLDGKYSQITLEPKTGSVKNKLIEVQYLIINDDKVLYISTVPSRYVYDKTDQYLLNTEGIVKYPNSYFLNSFYFGKIVKNTSSDTSNTTIEFRDKKNVMQWNLHSGSTIKHKTFELTTIDNYKIKNRKSKPPIKVIQSTITTDKSVNNKIIFENIYRFVGDKNSKHYFQYLSFQKPIKNQQEQEIYTKLKDSTISNDSLANTASIKNSKRRSEFVAKYKQYPAAKRIYVIYKDTSKTKVKELIIPFESPIKDEENAIRFKGNRVKFITPL